MCAAFSRLQTFNAKRLGVEKMREMLEYGVKHLTFALDLCEIQRRNGLYFLFEHPAGASSWSTAPMQRMLKRGGVKTYEGDLCCYDLTQVVKGEKLHIKKPTRFMTNSTFVGEALSEKCQGQHRHVELTGGGRTRRAEIYPDRLCRAILEGLVRQMQADGRIGCSFGSDETNGKRNVMMEIDDDNSMDIDEVT